MDTEHDAIEAVSAALLFVVTVILGWIAWRQFTTTRAQLRAYVKLSHTSPPGLQFEASGQPFVEMQVRNTGHTPTTVSEMRVRAVLVPWGGRLPPAPPIYGPPGREPRNAFLVAHMSAYFVERLDVGSDQLEQVNAGTQRLYIIGYVDYIDVFKARHRGGYARLYDPTPGLANNLGFVTETGYNYDRPRRCWERDGNQNI